jgi:hypothetical protein
MIVGLLLGYCARNWFANVLARGEQRKKCYDLIALIDQALRENKDPSFQSGAKVARSSAVAAASKKKVEEIKTGTEGAQTAFQTASAALAQRRNELAQKVAELGAIARADYHLPKSMEEALDNARSIIESDLTGSPAFNNVTAAGAAFDKVRSDVRKAAFTAADRWVRAAMGLDAVIDQLGPAFGLAGLEDLHTKLKGITDPVGAALDRLNGDTAGTIASLKATLDALHGNIYALAQLSGSIARAITNQLARLAQPMSGKPLLDEKAWNDWLHAAKAFAASVGNLVPADPDISPLSNALRLADQLRSALREQVADDAVRAEIDALLKQNKVAEAVAKAAEAVRRPAAAEEGQLKGVAPTITSREAAGEAPTPSLEAPTVVPALPMVYATYPAAAEPDASAITLLQARTEREIETAGLLQTLIFGAVIVGAGYFLFADKWIGTPMDFAAVLFWAFATDIGADAATTVAKSFKKAG